ncbi:MAG: hypothetical protein IJD38_08345 [Clostridia bacterium]|nr:hypothetical protein [Clostridia bacterium]
MFKPSVSISYQKEACKCGKYLYAIGGYHSTDTGCPAWGTSDPSDIRFIGDHLGDLVITYADGTADTVPLILGYTLWLHSTWMETPAPFMGEGKDDALAARLMETLSLYGAWDRRERWTLRVALRNQAVTAVEVVGNPAKNPARPVLSVYTVPWGTTEDQPLKKGTPVFTEAYVTDEETLPDLGEDAPAFFTSHTVDPSALPMERVREDLDAVCRALHTFDEDFEQVPTFEIPDNYHAYRVSFSGNPLAEIATGAVYHNMKNLCERTDPDGFIHTSYKNAPSWRYDGFGPYVLNANSYYDAYYARDCARAILTLNLFGQNRKALDSCRLGSEFMMAYPRDGVTLGSIPVPGHFSVMCNKPYIYSQLLIHHGWPTQYTPERFGEECGNLGNQETDGHGLMMMGTFASWASAGKDPAYVRENWDYIRECVKWIIWCFENPELSFMKDDLLYGETEAAMNDYTLYANIPCYLGLQGYIEMAAAAGFADEAALWQTYADRLQSGIDKGLTDGEGWNLEKRGFSHDPVVTMLADIYGYDTADMPTDWVARSRTVYPADLARTVEFGYYGVRGGIGYDHSMMTQNALLLDQTHDASELVESLCRICYAPRLPEPYLVPEGMAIDAEKGIFRRQGDLGNLVQLAEAMKCFHIVTGVSPVWGDTVKIMPRLPKGWHVSVKDFPLVNTKATVDMETVCPTDGTQSMTLALHGEIPAKALRIRFGPFAPDCETVSVTLNQIPHTLPTESNGDASWAWLTVKVSAL